MERRILPLWSFVLIGVTTVILSLSAQRQSIPLRPPLSQLEGFRRPPAQSKIAVEVETSTVFSIARPVGKDFVFLRDGSRLTGELITAEFSVQTAIGRLTLPTSVIAGIDRGPESSDIEVIATNGNDRFSGFLLHDFVLFRPMDAEVPVRIRLGRIAMLLLREANGGSDGAIDFHGIALKNGDYFRGRVSVSDVPFFSSTEIENATQEDVVSLFFPSERNPRARAFLKNGDVVLGDLVREDLGIQLGIGQSITVPSERVDVIDFSRGHRTDLMNRGPATPIYISDRSDQYDFQIYNDGIGVQGIKPDSEYYGVLQTGDRIVALDGVPYGQVPSRKYRGSSGRFTPLRGELVDGTRPQVFMTVKRNDELLLFRVMRR